MNASALVDIGRDFSRVPAGRHVAESDFSGEAFREKVLIPRLRQGGTVEVLLDNTEGYGSSFLEEAFGGLVRVGGFSYDYLKSHLVIVANSAATTRYASKIWEYIKDARSERR